MTELELKDVIRPGALRGLDFVTLDELRKRTGVNPDSVLKFALWLNGNGPLRAEEALCVVESLRPKGMHRVFPVDVFLPSFKCNFYKQSLGLTVTADKSHPGFLEVHEDWPVWVQLTLEHIEAHTKIDFDQRSQDREIVHNLAKQIRAHLYAVESIGKAAEGLRQSVVYLPENVGKAVEDGIVRAVSSFLTEGLGKGWKQRLRTLKRRRIQVFKTWLHKRSALRLRFICRKRKDSQEWS